MTIHITTKQTSGPTRRHQVGKWISRFTSTVPHLLGWEGPPIVFFTDLSPFSFVKLLLSCGSNGWVCIALTTIIEKQKRGTLNQAVVCSSVGGVWTSQPEIYETSSFEFLLLHHTHRRACCTPRRFAEHRRSLEADAGIIIQLNPLSLPAAPINTNNEPRYTKPGIMQPKNPHQKFIFLAF